MLLLDRFKQILNGPAKEGSQNIYEINDCGEGKFEMFYNWTNTSVASVRYQKLPLVYGAHQRRRSVKLYEFASSYSIPTLQNYALDMFYRCSLNTRNIDCHEIWAIYDHTPYECNMKYVMVHLMVENYFRHMFPPKDKVFPDEFLNDVLERADDQCIDLGNPGAPSPAMDEDWKMSTDYHFCNYYHEHPE